MRRFFLLFALILPLATMAYSVEPDDVLVKETRKECAILPAKKFRLYDARELSVEKKAMLQDGMMGKGVPAISGSSFEDIVVYVMLDYFAEAILSFQKSNDMSMLNAYIRDFEMHGYTIRPNRDGVYDLGGANWIVDEMSKRDGKEGKVASSDVALLVYNRSCGIFEKHDVQTIIDCKNTDQVCPVYVTGQLVLEGIEIGARKNLPSKEVTTIMIGSSMVEIVARKNLPSKEVQSEDNWTVEAALSSDTIAFDLSHGLWNDACKYEDFKVIRDRINFYARQQHVDLPADGGKPLEIGEDKYYHLSVDSALYFALDRYVDRGHRIASQVRRLTADQIIEGWLSPYYFVVPCPYDPMHSNETEPTGIVAWVVPKNEHHSRPLSPLSAMIESHINASDTATSNENHEEAEANQIFTVVERNPEFPGGKAALMQFLKKNLKYPAFAAENGIQGRVLVVFTIEKDGSVANIEIMRSPAEELSKEVFRVITNMPRWKAGRVRGKPMRTNCVLPVTFSLHSTLDAKPALSDCPPYIPGNYDNPIENYKPVSTSLEQHVVERQADLDLRFRAGDYGIDRTLGSNDSQLNDLGGILGDILWVDGEEAAGRRIDSIRIVCTFSPEGRKTQNMKLASKRTQSLETWIREEIKKYGSQSPSISTSTKEGSVGKTQVFFYYVDLSEPTEKMVLTAYRNKKWEYMDAYHYWVLFRSDELSKENKLELASFLLKHKADRVKDFTKNLRYKNNDDYFDLVLPLAANLLAVNNIECRVYNPDLLRPFIDDCSRTQRGNETCTTVYQGETKTWKYINLDMILYNQILTLLNAGGKDCLREADVLIQILNLSVSSTPEFRQQYDSRVFMEYFRSLVSDVKAVPL